MSELFLSGWRRVVVAVALVDAAVLALVVGLTLASGGFDGRVVAGGLSLVLFFAMTVWLYVVLRSSGYRSADRIYDSEFHAIQTDQQLQTPGELAPRRLPRGLHATMGGIVVSLVVLLFVFTAL